MEHVPLNLCNSASLLHIGCRLSYDSITSLLKSAFRTTFSMKVQKSGFQNREDGALLEGGGSASVRNWYTRPGLPKFASYSMSTKLR